MATHKKLNSEYYIETTDVYITGNLHVRGAYDTTEVVDSTITDRNIYLNAGEPITNAGVNNGTGTSGIVVERGSLANVALRWDEVTSRWQIDSGTGFYNISTTSGGGNLTVADDTSPALGGNLNTRQFTIFSNVGNLKFGGNLQINYTDAVPGMVANAAVVYADDPAGGSSGVYVVNGSALGQELVTKTRAFGFSLIL